jgi:hypothetical protein
MKKHLVPLTLLVASLFTVGCGAQSHYVIKKNSQPLSSFKVVEVKAFVLNADVEKGLDASQRVALDGLMAMMAPQLVADLQKRGLKSSPDISSRLVIEGRVASYAPGSQFLRWLIPGAGSSKIVTEVRFNDAAGNEIGSSDFTGGVSSGVFGGNDRRAVERLSDEIAMYVVNDGQRK